MAFTVTNLVDGNTTPVDVNTDGSLWEIIYDIKANQAEELMFVFEYTKDTSTEFTIQVSYSFDPRLLVSNKFNELIVDLPNTKTEKALITHAHEGSHALFIPISKIPDKVHIFITPDVSTGNDTLKVYVEQNIVKSYR